MQSLFPRRTETGRPIAARFAVNTGSRVRRLHPSRLFRTSFQRMFGLAKTLDRNQQRPFEMDPRVTLVEVYEFRSKRSEWVKKI
jgi:hypothetical protein